MEKKIVVAIVAVVFLILWFLVGGGSTAHTDLCFNSPKGAEDSKCIEVEIADDYKSQKLGLTGRDSLGRDRGMLFVFGSESKRAFWMKGMKFPLDIIWINRDKEIVDIAGNVPPCNTRSCPTYAPKNDSLYVLEVNANFTGRYNITNETMVFFRLPK